MALHLSQERCSGGMLHLPQEQPLKVGLPYRWPPLQSMAKFVVAIAGFQCRNHGTKTCRNNGTKNRQTDRSTLLLDYALKASHVVAFLTSLNQYFVQAHTHQISNFFNAVLIGEIVDTCAFQPQGPCSDYTRQMRTKNLHNVHTCCKGVYLMVSYKAFIALAYATKRYTLH